MVALSTACNNSYAMQQPYDWTQPRTRAPNKDRGANCTCTFETRYKCQQGNRCFEVWCTFTLQQYTPAVAAYLLKSFQFGICLNWTPALTWDCLPCTAPNGPCESIVTWLRCYWCPQTQFSCVSLGQWTALWPARQTHSYSTANFFVFRQSNFTL